VDREPWQSFTLPVATANIVSVTGAIPDACFVMPASTGGLLECDDIEGRAAAGVV
jgi:hypothetical protein